MWNLIHITCENVQFLFSPVMLFLIRMWKKSQLQIIFERSILVPMWKYPIHTVILKIKKSQNLFEMG